MNSGFALQGFVEDRIVVSDLGLGCPIWYNVDDRSKESLDPFYKWLGVKKAKKIQGDVMDMWKVFEKSTRTENRPTLELPAKFLYEHAFEYTMKKIDGLET